MPKVVGSDNPYENGTRFSLQRTTRGGFGVNESLTRAEVLDLADGVKETNPALAKRLVTVAGD